MRTKRDWRTSGLRTCRRCNELTEPGTPVHLAGYCSQWCYCVATLRLIPFVLISVGVLALVVFLAWLTS